MEILNGILAALRAAAATAVSSFGAALALGLNAIAAGFLPAEREILVKAKAAFMTAYDAKKATGASEIDAIEGAATACYNEFCHDEATFMVDEVKAVITLTVSSLKSAAGLK